MLTPFGILLPDGERVHARAPSEQSGRKHAGVVQDQAVPWPQKIGELAKPAVFPAPLRAMEHQHARTGAIRQRLLGDQFGGQFVIEGR